MNSTLEQVLKKPEVLMQPFQLNIKQVQKKHVQVSFIVQVCWDYAFLMLISKHFINIMLFYYTSVSIL